MTTSRKYRAHGLCARCGCVCGDSWYCQACKAKRAASRKLRNKWRARLGQCQMCDKPAATGIKLCEEHRQSEKLRILYSRMVAAA